jgi:shikimate kinase
MGCGKTTVGKLLSKRQNKRFVDVDHELVHRTGVPITTIFEIEGEVAFRDRETLVLADLVLSDNQVLATGGGVVLREANRQTLRQHGTVVYLHAEPQLLWHRLMQGTGVQTRPILKSTDPLQKLSELYLIRDQLYRDTAHHIINLAEGRPAQVAAMIEHSLNLASPI